MADRDPGRQFETQSQFADRLGMNKSSITRAKQAGRLVMTPEGMVDVQASLLAMAATEGTLPAHEANRERLAALREQAPVATEPPAARVGAPEPADKVAQSLTVIGHNTKLANMQRLQAMAEMARRENELAAGKVVDREEVRAALTTAVGIILGAAEPMPDDLTPVLVGVAEADKVRAILRDWLDEFLTRVSEALTKAGDARR